MTDDVLGRHAATARLIQNRLVQRIINLTADDIANLPVTEVARLWSEAVKVEQLSMQGSDADLGFDTPADRPTPVPVEPLDALPEMDDAALDRLAAALRGERARRRKRLR